MIRFLIYFKIFEIHNLRILKILLPCLSEIEELVTPQGYHCIRRSSRSCSSTSKEGSVGEVRITNSASRGRGVAVFVILQTLLVGGGV